MMSLWKRRLQFLNVNEMLTLLRNHSKTITRIKNEMPHQSYINGEILAGNDIDTIKQGLDMAIIILEKLHGHLDEYQLKDLERRVMEISVYAEKITRYLDR